MARSGALARAKAADPSGFEEISFCEARFGFSHCAREIVALWILGLPQRLLDWSPQGIKNGPQYIGADFTGRTIRSMADFSRARFDQPPALGDIRQADSLDLAWVIFSFRGWAWPQWQYWTTRTDKARQRNPGRGREARSVHSRANGRARHRVVRLVGQREAPLGSSPAEAGNRR